MNDTNDRDPMQTVRLLPRRTGRFLQMLMFHFIRDGGMQNAAALTYTTLLSLVPLMTVSFALFSAFPVYDKVGDDVQDFVFQNFVPASGEVVQNYLAEFRNKASQITGAGAIILVIVALMLMANIDRALNAIWRVRRKRHLANLVLVYWAILSLGPVLIGISVALTSYLVSLPLFTEAAESVGLGVPRLLRFLPAVVSAVAFTLLYILVPNRRVPLLHAILGGTLAALLFELAKQGFAFYVTHFPTYEAIYGALATIPIFLIWIYLSWLVTLLGAEFTYCLGVYRDDWDSRVEPRGEKLLLAYRVLSHLWQYRAQGRGLTLRQLATWEQAVPEEVLEQLLYKLRESQLLLLTDKGAWALARDMSEVTLLDLYQAAPFMLPRDQLVAEDNLSDQPALAELLQQINGNLSNIMNRPLAELFPGPHVA